MDRHRWIVVAGAPFLPARGGGEREHLGFVRAAAEAGSLQLLVVPSSGELDVGAYRPVMGSIPVVAAPRRMNPLLLAHPVKPFVVASRPASPGLVSEVGSLARGATGIVVFSYKSWRIGEALARELRLPAVLRQHNLEGAYHLSLARGTKGLRGLVLRVEAGRIDRDERRVDRAPWLRAVADISAHDADERRRRGANAVHVPPFAFDASLGMLARNPDGGRRMLFLGALDIATNTTAIDWFLDGPWPTIRQRVPDAVLDVVGRGPSPQLRARLAREAGVVVHADVPEIRSFLARSSVAVNPAVSGSGVNIKLIDYLQAGLPVVSTTIATRGLAVSEGRDLLTADEPGPFADAVCALLSDPQRAEAMGAAGRHTISQLLDPVRNIQRLEAAFS